MTVGVERVTDGRRARRERGRAAVTEAMIDLMCEGEIVPSADLVAERAGVSVASIFRYFETLDDLRRSTIELYFARYAHLFGIPDCGMGTFATRLDGFVRSRVTLYETVAPMARLARARTVEHRDLDEVLHLARAIRADEIRRHFDPELGRFTPAARDDTVAIISTMTSFECWDQARRDHRRSAVQLRRAWSTALPKVLMP
jgi:AcrR family transcriptional regulator